MAKNVKPIAEGYHSITPILVMRNASEAIAYYKEAFGATELFRQDRPDGKVMHAALKIGDSIVMVGDECLSHEGHEQECVRSPIDLRGTTTTLYLYVEDADKVFERAMKAGGQVMMPVTDMFWGDRVGMLKDPYGHYWSVATHTEDLTHEEIKERAEKCQPLII